MCRNRHKTSVKEKSECGYRPRCKPELRNMGKVALDGGEGWLVNNDAKTGFPCGKTENIKR